MTEVKAITADADERQDRSPRARSDKATTRVMIVERDQTHLRWLGRILGSIGRVDERLALTSVPQEDEADLLVVNFDGMEPGLRSELMKSFATPRRTILLVISDVRSRKVLAELIESRAIHNLLAKNGRVDSQDVLVTVQKLLRREVFGLAKYFLWGVESITTTVRCSAQRREVLDLAHSYALSMQVQSRLANRFCTVVDELLTNALYNAPRDANGNSRYAHLPRTQSVELAPGEEITITLCCDGRRLGVAAIDPFGSISKERIVDYLTRCFRGGSDQVEWKEGGAGLGLFTIFDGLSHFVVNINPGRATEMIGLIDIEGSYKDFADKGKSFNVFVGS